MFKIFNLVFQSCHLIAVLRLYFPESGVHGFSGRITKEKFFDRQSYKFSKFSDMGIDDSSLALFDFPICIGGNIKGLSCLSLGKIFTLSVGVYVVFDGTLIHGSICFRQKYEIKER